jgi:anti-sigma factor RsiW
MKVTQSVIHDLLPAYVAGEASADTVALVEEFLRQDPELARTIETLRANPLPALPDSMPPTKEKETLNMTKQLLRWRGILMGFAIFLSLLPFSFQFANGKITWTFLRESPPPVTAAVCAAALACWGGFLYVRRRLQGTGL